MRPECRFDQVVAIGLKTLAKANCLYACTFSVLSIREVIHALVRGGRYPSTEWRSIPVDPDARSTSLIACPECFHPHPSTVVRPDMSSNQVMARGFMDSGYGGCLLHAQGILPVAFCREVIHALRFSEAAIPLPAGWSIPIDRSILIEAQFCTFSSSHLDGSMPSIHTSPTRAKQEEQVKYLPKHTPF